MTTFEKAFTTSHVDIASELDKSKFKDILDEGKPVLMKDCDFGDCMSKWRLDYLTDQLGHHDVTIHESGESALDFIGKNFRYRSCKFSEFSKLLTREDDEDKSSVYLRSTNSNTRSRKPASIDLDFPEISHDLKPPDYIPYGGENRLYHSSVLRIASKSVQIWTHFDCYENVLCQIVGFKRVLLIPPEDSRYLYVEGDKSRIANFDRLSKDIERFPLIKKARIYLANLSPGDCLFIPSLWWHNIKTVECLSRFNEPGYSIGLNIFWRDPEIDARHHYAENDVYGNKNLLPYESALANIQKALEHLNKLPDKCRPLYTELLNQQFRRKFKLDDD